MNETVIWSELDDTEPTTTTFLLYGGSGVGKTRLSAQFPRPLFLSFDPGKEGGLLSAREFKPKYIAIRTYEQLLGVLTKLEPLVGTEFDTIVVDSISYMARVLMQSILIKSLRETPRFDEWGLLVERMRNMIVKISDFNCFTVFTATENLVKDEISGKLMGGPNLPGKLAQEIPQACDVVCRLFVKASFTQDGRKAVKYCFQSTPDDMWMAKDRTMSLPTEAETKIEFFKPLFGEKGKV